MRIVEQNKTKTHKTNYTLLIIFCLLAFAGKSYAWHFGPETDASNWEYEKNFGITISQKTSMDSELAAVSMVQGTHVEIKAENNGLLPAASGNLVCRKIQTLKKIGVSDEFIIKFKYTAIRESSSPDPIYPQNCMFDICHIGLVYNSAGYQVIQSDHHYKSINNLATTETKKHYQKNGKHYYIVTGEFVMKQTKDFSSQDIEIRVWPQDGVNFQKLLISDVEVVLTEDIAMPSNETDVSKWVFPSGYAVTPEYVNSVLPELPTSSSFKVDGSSFKHPYILLTEWDGSNYKYIPNGKFTRTVSNLKPGTYKVELLVAAWAIGHAYTPEDCHFYTGNDYNYSSSNLTEYNTAKDEGRAIKLEDIPDNASKTYYYNGNVKSGFRVGKVSINATVGNDGILKFTIWSCGNKYNFLAFKDFTVTGSEGTGVNIPTGLTPDSAPSPAPDDIPKLTVTPQSGYKFTHTHGSVYDKSPRPSDFPSGDNKEWKTNADDPRIAEGVKLQWTHEYVHDVYVMPGDECELEPFSDFHTAAHGTASWDYKYCDTYHRWYDYTTDQACGRLYFLNDLYDNNDKVIVYGDGSGHAKGHFGGEKVNKLDRAATRAIYRAPLNTNSQEIFDIVAIDVACNDPGDEEAGQTLNEPTLTYRHIFVIHSARSKADYDCRATDNNNTEQRDRTVNLSCPEGTPFQYRLDNFEYRGKGTNQKATGYYHKVLHEEGGEAAFEYAPVYHYRVQLFKLNSSTGSYELQGSTTILGAYGATGAFTTGSDLNKNENVQKTTEEKEEELCGRMLDDLVYTYKGINGYDRVIYWKKPTVGKYLVRLCAVDIRQENNGSWIAEDIKAAKEQQSIASGKYYSDNTLVLQSYYIDVMPKKDANMVSESELTKSDFQYIYQRPDEMVKEYGDPFDVVNFDLTDEEKQFMSSGNSNDAGYYKFPLAWDESAYGFGYDKTFDYDMYVVANSSDQSRVPYTRNKPNHIVIHDRLYADTNGSKTGNFLYVNAASDPGHMAKVSLGNELCANNRVYVSAWINEFNNNAETANLVFTFRGINSKTKQPEVISRYVTGYIPGGSNTANGFVVDNNNATKSSDDNYPNPDPDHDCRGQWMHVYYYFDPPSDIKDRGYGSYEITLENNCTSSDGADYAIDDIRAFICRPNIKATQTKPICNGEASSNIELATDFDLLLKAYAGVYNFSEQFSTVANPTDLYYTIIDKEKYMAEIDKKSSTMDAFNASVVKGIYGATGDNDEYGKFTFYAYYDQNMLRTTATDDDKKQNTTRDASSGRRMLYFPDYIKSDGLKSNTPYWIVIAAYNYDVQQYYINPLSMCSNAREFTVTVGNVIKIDGQPTASRHGLNICSNQRPKISVDMTGVTSSGTPATGYTYDHFDWFIGNKEAFEAAEYNDVGLEESLAAFRDRSGHYSDDETALRNLTPTGSFTAGMKACLLHFIDAKKLSLYKTVEFPSTYDQFDEDPNGTSIALTIIPVDPYHNPDILFCLEPFDVEIPISTREPSMKNGDDSGVIQYTMDDVPLRIGLTQLKNCSTIDPDNMDGDPSNYLLMPLRDVHVETTGVTALIEKSDDDLIYLVDTNDPAVKTSYSAFGAKSVKTFTSTTDKTGFAEDTVLYIGKVSDIKADVWDKTDPTATNPGNKCKLAFFNNIKFREGYWYTIRFSYQEKYTSTVTKDQDVCPGDVLCTIKVVPEYQMWTGAENGNWNNDNNWRRVTKAELLNPTSISNDFITDGGTNDNTASFVPADFTKVIIPAEPTNPLILYGLRETDNKSAVTFAGGNGTSYFIKNMVKTTTGGEPIVGYTAAIDTASYKINFDMSSVDLSDGNVACRAWYDHTCDQIHFNSEAQMISQQYLHYNKAWADVEVVPGRWYTFTSPITNVVAGDFYLPSESGRQDTPLFEDITYNTEKNDRFKPAVYQRTWDAKDATLWHEDATSTQVGTALNWSHVYNETNVNYDTGKGSSIKVDVSAMPSTAQPSKVKFRFPKADTKYTYYKPGNELGEKDPEDVLSAAMVGGKRTYRIEDFTSAVEQVVGENTNGTKDTYYLVGNPFMCELDLEKFFETNTQFQKKLWTLTEGSQRVVVMTGDAVISTSATNNALTQRYVQPFQSFFLALKEAPAEGATIKAKFDASMMHVPDGSSSPSNGKQRKSAAAPADGGLLRISTATADGIESAVVLADGIVRKTAGAETLFDSNLAEDVTVYSVINGQAMTIAEVADVDTIPIGITRNEGETDINITGVASFGRPMWIADAETGEVKSLDEDITLKQSGNGVRYYLLSRLASAKKPEISTPLLRTDKHAVSITAPAAAELTDLRIVTTSGMNVTNIANAGNEYTTELAEGIYIITLRCNNASYTYKVVIW